MRRVVVALALAAGGSLTSYDAAAAPPSCHGRPATIAGTRGQTITGTPGNDVVVTTGGTIVDPGAGDDLVCVISSPGPIMGIEIMAGLGSDTVDTTGFDGGALVYLTAGGGTGDAPDPPTDSDTFEGGYGPDAVYYSGLGSVHIDTGNGDDEVSGPSRTGDSVDLGDGNDAVDGNDVVTATLQTEHSSYVGGSGRNTLHLMDPATNAEKAYWIVDNTLGTATRAGSTVVAWTDFTSFEIQVPASYVNFVGGPRAEQVAFVADPDRRVSNRIIADTGAGDDTVSVVPGEVDMDGGPGEDRLDIDSSTPVFSGTHEGFRPSPYVDLDLGNGVLSFGGTIPLGRVTTVEEVAVDATRHGSSASAVDLRGDAGPNRLVVTGGGCTVAVSGRGGADVIRADGARYCQGTPASGLTRHLDGGAGDDRITGGPGRDLAEGGPGIDTCRLAEKRVSCER